MNIRSPVYANAEGTRIDCEVEHPQIGWIPLTADPGDQETAAIHARLVAGEAGAISPYVAPPVQVPQSVTPKQARLALNAAGLLDQVEAIIAAADKASQIQWTWTDVIHRDHPLVATFQTQLDPPLSDSQVDDLFVAAKQYD